MTPFEIIIGIVAGLTAGVINTLAGNGSAITLAVLLELFGLPPHMANGTNRVGVLMQTSASVLSFQREGRLEVRDNLPAILIPTLGAILGIYLAIIVSADGFIAIYKYLLVFMLILILFNPKRWIHQKSGEISPSRESRWMWLIYFALGIYGGFIQMGMGIFTIAAFVLLGNRDLISANVLKALIITALTIVAVLVFSWQGMIHWGYGLTIGVGQMAGGWFTAQFASRHSKAALVAYYVLVICILGAIYSVFFR